ncbi:MAG TPA: RNA polymerase sigma factor [Ignavibacteria bacterium]|nr:RNA polymerase sigma factor [Ignavibacteria bacterium]
MNEEQLIKEIKNNHVLFEKIYNKHYTTIFNYCYRRTGDFDASKDITSETFLKAYLNIHKFIWKGIPIISWLYRITTNEINLYYRSKKYKPKLLNKIYSENFISTNIEKLEEEKLNAELEMEKHEQFLKVQSMLKKIPLKYREVIILKYYERLKIKEISIILNKKEGTVKSLLSRGISMLRKKI